MKGEKQILSVCQVVKKQRKDTKRNTQGKAKTIPGTIDNANVKLKLFKQFNQFFIFANNDKTILNAI